MGLAGRLAGWLEGLDPSLEIGNSGAAITTVGSYTVGTLVLDMFDARTHQAVWRGSATATVPASLAKQDAAIRVGVAKMFAAFPPTPGG